MEMMYRFIYGTYRVEKWVLCSQETHVESMLRWKQPPDILWWTINDCADILVVSYPKISTHLKMISRTVVVPVVLVISVSSAIVHHSIIGALRVRFRLVPCCGEIIGLCADTGVWIFFLGELIFLWLLAPGLKVILMSVDLSIPFLIRVPVMRVTVTAILIQRDISN